jgi:hypothetical protein
MGGERDDVSPIRDEPKRFLALATVIVWLTVAPVSAQSFVGAAVLASWQPDNSPYVGAQNPSLPAQGIHGSAVGLSGTVGFFAGPSLGLAAEFSLPGRFTADQVADKYRTHNANRADHRRSVSTGQVA